MRALIIPILVLLFTTSDSISEKKLFVTVVQSSSIAMGTCVGSSSCSACSNCSRCAHCNSGGACGVCAAPASMYQPYVNNTNTLSRTSNGLSISDLYLFKKVADVKTVEKILASHNEILSQGSLGKDSEGCEVNRYIINRKTLELTYGQILYKGILTPVFSVKYLIPADEYQNFENEMLALKYKKEREFIASNGQPIALWGADNFLEMKLFSIMPKGLFYEIIIVM